MQELDFHSTPVIKVSEIVIKGSCEKCGFFDHEKTKIFNNYASNKLFWCKRYKMWTWPDSTCKSWVK